MQCWKCSKWVHLRFIFLSSSEFSSIFSSHSWRCSSCHISVSPEGPQSSNTVSSFLALHHVYLHCAQQSTQPFLSQCSSSLLFSFVNLPPFSFPVTNPSIGHLPTLIHFQLFLTFCFFFLLTRSIFSNGAWKVLVSKKLNLLTLFWTFQSILSVSRNLISSLFHLS